jgi:hypothetical protein
MKVNHKIAAGYRSSAAKKSKYLLNRAGGGRLLGGFQRRLNRSVAGRSEAKN